MNKYHRLFGYGGLIPFISLALLFQFQDDLPLTFLENSASTISSWLISYAALIYSFIGGIYWHTTLNRHSNPFVLTFAILMMLWAWLWILAIPLIPIWLMAVSFFILPIIESQWLKEALGSEFRTMRFHLSMVAGICLFVSVKTLSP